LGFERRTGKKSWTDQIGWNHIKCVCFKANDLYESDEILIFTDIRPESYVIPTEADDGETVLPELIHRKLYDAELGEIRGRVLICDYRKTINH
jgi:hypothetical protein